MLQAKLKMMIESGNSNKKKKQNNLKLSSKCLHKIQEEQKSLVTANVIFNWTSQTPPQILFYRPSRSREMLIEKKKRNNFKLWWGDSKTSKKKKADSWALCKNR